MERRKQRLIRHDVQLRVVFISLAVASLVLLVNFQLSLAAIWSESSNVTPSTNATVALEGLRAAIINKFLVSIGLSIPLAAVIGILYSFKFAGPLYRFQSYFSGLKDGRWDRQCALRKGDDLWDLCDAINAGMEPMQKQIQEEHAIITEMHELLTQGSLSANGDAQEKVKALQERVAGANTIYAERFPKAMAPVSAEPETSASGPALQSSKELEPQV